MKSRGSTGHTSDTIYYDRGYIVKNRDKIQRAGLRSYEPAVPKGSSAGKVYEEIQEMITVVGNIYKQTDLLIDATVKALDDINIKIKSADEAIAKHYKDYVR